VLDEARQLKTRISDIETREEQLNAEMEGLAVQLPNITSMDTPVGDEAQVISYINEHPEPVPSASDRVWRSHVHIGSELSCWISRLPLRRLAGDGITHQ
jgi:seryl-tRNA synthetase